MALNLLFATFIIVSFFSFIYSYYIASRQIINAYSFFLLEYFVKIFISPLLPFLFFGQIDYLDSSFTVLLYSTFFLISLFLGYISSFIPRLLSSYFSIFKSNARNIRIIKVNLLLFSFIFFVLSVISYLLLMVKSGVGTMWIFNTREAYQFHRSGAGMYYVFSQFFLYISFIFTLFRFRNRSILFISCITLLFSTLFFFFGSKRTIITALLIGVVFYSYFIHRISFIFTSIFAFLVACIFLLSQYFYSNYGILGAIKYFDYFHNMTLFIDRNPNFDLMYGRCSFLDSLWLLVPRSLYPEKPFVYGSAHITEMVYPGAAQATHYLGVLPWATFYLDFKVVGIIIGGYTTGTCLRFLQILCERRANIFVFILFFNYGVSTILNHIPTFVLFSLMLITLTLLRIRFYNETVS